MNIFRLTQPYHPYIIEYHPTVAAGPRHPWLEILRTKKALTLVCKSWSAPATEFLYCYYSGSWQFYRLLRVKGFRRLVYFWASLNSSDIPGKFVPAGLLPTTRNVSSAIYARPCRVVFNVARP